MTRSLPRTVLCFIVPAISLVLFAWLAKEVFEGDMKRFDDAVRGVVHAWASPRMTEVMRGLTFLGSVIFLVSASLLLCAVFWWRKWRTEAKGLALAMVGAGGLDVVLKHFFHRARPVPFFGALPSSYSFPSGHALSSLCFYGMLAGLLGVRLRRGWLRALLWTAAALLVGAIGLSRIYLGVHYPTDVVAGYLAAALWIGGLLGYAGWRA